jgi:hypothetical protein
MFDHIPRRFWHQSSDSSLFISPVRKRSSWGCWIIVVLQDELDALCQRVLKHIIRILGRQHGRNLVRKGDMIRLCCASDQLRLRKSWVSSLIDCTCNGDGWNTLHRSYCRDPCAVLRGSSCQKPCLNTVCYSSVIALCESCSISYSLMQALCDASPRMLPLLCAVHARAISNHGIHTFNNLSTSTTVLAL